MVYFITESYLKTYTGYNNNIDMHKVEYLIQLCYEINVVELLGYHFSGWLLDKHQSVRDGNDTYTTVEERFVGYLQGFMSWYVNYDSVIELSDQLQNKGSLRQTGDFQIPSSESSTYYKSNKYKKNYESYKRIMSDFLCKNKEHFPEFISDQNDDSLIKKECRCCGDLDNLSDTGIMIV